MPENHKFELIPVRPSLLNVDHTYQRDVPEKEIHAILSKWNYDLVNPPKVSKRSDGSLYIVDGQHTALAWKLHENDDPIECKVFSGLTHDEEVELFLQQFGVKTEVSATQKARARYNRNSDADADIVATINQARAVGVTISFFPTTAKNTTNAIVACEKSFKRLGAIRFGEALLVLKNAWDGDHEGLSFAFIAGITELFANYYGEINRPRLMSALSKNSPAYYRRMSKDYPYKTTGKKMAYAFVVAYNNATKSGQKIAFRT